MLDGSLVFFRRHEQPMFSAPLGPIGGSQIGSADTRLGGMMLASYGSLELSVIVRLMCIARTMALRIFEARWWVDGWCGGSFRRCKGSTGR